MMKKYISKYKRKLILIGGLLVSLIGGVSASYIFSSSQVSYDNFTSGMVSDNVQDAIDELYVLASLSERVDDLETVISSKADNDYWETIYPVGSIYTTVDNTNPGTLFGGTWVSFGSGKAPVGVDTSDTSFDTVEETGGEKTHTLTADETAMKAHSHTMNHGHGNTIKATTPAFSHSITQPAFTLPNHTHTATVWLNNGSSASSTHYGLTYSDRNGAKGGTYWSDVVSVGNPTSLPNCNRTTNVAISNHAASDCTMSGSVTNYTGSTGSTTAADGTAHNNLQPYITVYMWKRTA